MGTRALERHLSTQDSHRAIHNTQILNSIGGPLVITVIDMCGGVLLFLFVWVVSASSRVGNEAASLNCGQRVLGSMTAAIKLLDVSFILLH